MVGGGLGALRLDADTDSIANRGAPKPQFWLKAVQKIKRSQSCDTS